MPKSILADPKTDLLRSLNLTEKGKYNRAASLLFAENPEQWIPGAWVKIGFFVTDDDLRYQDEVHGSLIEQVDKVIDLLLTKYLKAYIRYEGIQRIERFLFPEEALREAVLNAIIHKDYSSSVPIQISVYDDKLVIWNSGQLPDQWTLQDLCGKHPSSPFNPIVANAFFRAGLIESWGRGIEKIRTACKQHQIKDVVFDTRLAGMMVTFVANPEHIPNDITSKIFPEMSGKMSGKIVATMKAEPGITIPEIAQKVDRTERTIYRLVNQLKQQGIVKRIGPDKGGHWEVH